MEARITSMESRLQPPPTSNPAASMPYGMPGYGSTTLASSSSTAAATLSTAPPTSSPTSSAPFSYGMPGYGSTSLGSPSFTAAATMATAAFPSFTAPSPMPGSAADVRLPNARASPAAIVPSVTKDLCADIRVTIVQIQAALQEMIQLERKRGGCAPTSGNAQVLSATAHPRDAQGATRPSGFIHLGGSAAAGCSTRSPGAETATGDAPEDARDSLDGGRPWQRGAHPRPVRRPPAITPMFCCLHA